MTYSDRTLQREALTAAAFLCRARHGRKSQEPTCASCLAAITRDVEGIIPNALYAPPMVDASPSEATGGEVEELRAELGDAIRQWTSWRIESERLKKSLRRVEEANYSNLAGRDALRAELSSIIAEADADRSTLRAALAEAQADSAKLREALSEIASVYCPAECHIIAGDALAAPEEPRGTFTCPICGLDKPHVHTDAEITEYRGNEHFSNPTIAATLNSAPHAGDGVPEVREEDVALIRDAANRNLRSTSDRCHETGKQYARILAALSYCATRQGGK